MPIECELLTFCPSPFDTCPECRKPFRPFLRGTVQRSPLTAPLHWLRCWWKKEVFKHVAVICSECKDIVGWECPEDYDQLEDWSPEFPYVRRNKEG